MEDQQDNHIRESSRMFLKHHRQNVREGESDLRRSLAPASIHPKTVTEIANKLKTKASMSVEELGTLKNALMDDDKHVETVLRTHGALRGLVREISGNDIKKQCEAVGCCCNLALVERAGPTVAKTAGPYLVTGLDSLSSDLAVNCAWTLGNLAASGTEARQLLTSQGALSKLLAAADSSNEDVADAALYALTHFLYGLKELSPDHTRQLLKTAFIEHNPSSSIHLLYMLSWDPDFVSKLSVEFLQRVLGQFSVSTLAHLNENHVRGSNCCNFVFFVRLLANVSAGIPEFSNLILKYFVDYEFVLGFKQLVVGNDFDKDLMWLLGNLWRFSDNDLCKKYFFGNVCA